jgi:membrane-bound metal-dependent hydrolase YbcI (DUF457 family)
MDNLTHSLVALTLAQTPLRRAGRGATLVLLLSSNAPDVEIVTTVAGGTASYLMGHRGVTHGPLGVLGLAAAAAVLVRLVQGRRRDTDRASLRALFGVALVGCLCHILMDLPTSYGTRLLSPFIGTWYAADWLPIIDAYLLAILAAGLVAARLKPAARGRVVATTLLLTVGYYALRGTLHHQALVRAAGDVPAAVVGLHAWADRPESKLPSDRVCAAGWTAARVPTAERASACPVDAAALPTFASPFRWRLIREYSTGYAISEIDLARSPEAAVLASGWRPSEASAWVRAASAARSAQILLSFSRFPAARVVERRPDRVDVRIEEVRFLASADPTRDDARAGSLFTLLVRLGPTGRTLEEHFGR